MQISKFCIFGLLIAAASYSTSFAQSTSPSIDDIMAKVVVLNETELQQAIQAGKAIQDDIFANLSDKDKKRLAKLGQKMWEDCPNYFDANNLTRAPGSSDSKKRLRLVSNSTRRRSELFKNVAAKLSEHPSYKMNSDKRALETLTNGRADPSNSDTQLWAAANSMRCTIELTELAGTKNNVAATIIQKPFLEAKKSVRAK